MSEGRRRKERNLSVFQVGLELLLQQEEELRPDWSKVCNQRLPCCLQPSAACVFQAAAYSTENSWTAVIFNPTFNQGCYLLKPKLSITSLLNSDDTTNNCLSFFNNNSTVHKIIAGMILIRYGGDGFEVLME